MENKPGDPPSRCADESAPDRPAADPDESQIEPALHETVRGHSPGSVYIRRTGERDQKLRRVGEGDYEATTAALTPATQTGRILAKIRHRLIGPPIATADLPQERLSKLKALAIFSSDNLSSSAYATEEMLLILMIAGSGSLHASMPLAVGIALLVAVVATSYVQLVRAYPGGGGAYSVTRENLGAGLSLVAGSALFIDYVLTVAVSTAAGVAAVTSAIPGLLSLRVEIAIGFVALLTLGNLRGIREAGTIFAVPSYIFIFGFGGMILVGFIRLLLGHDLAAVEPERAVTEGASALTLFLVLRAFASGSSALTGIEAIADGVPSFKPPEARNASITLVWMASILALFFLGTTALANEIGVIPSPDKTVVSQIAATVFGGENAFFYFVQAATALILILAANTAFAGLPTLASVMARDGVMPKQFAFRGDRLAFSHGILVLGVVASVVLIAFEAETHRIIPLYAVGVFLAFTLSQAGMVVHWRRSKEPGWRRSLLLNAAGMCATAAVAVIVGVTKLTEGAWLSFLGITLLFLALRLVRAHYQDADQQLGTAQLSARDAFTSYQTSSAARDQMVIVPVDEINFAVLHTVAYARSLSLSAVAVHVTEDHSAAEAFRLAWRKAIPDVPLVTLESPYRSLVEPIMAYIDGIERKHPEQIVTVVLPEFVPKAFWQKTLHNQLARRLKAALVDRPNTAIIEVPYRLR